MKTKPPKHTAAPRHISAMPATQPFAKPLQTAASPNGTPDQPNDLPGEVNKLSRASNKGTENYKLPYSATTHYF
jgi:hypothetical protein